MADEEAVPIYDEFVRWVSESLEMLGFPEDSYAEVKGARGSIADFVMGPGPKVLLVAKGSGPSAAPEI